MSDKKNSNNKRMDLPTLKGDIIAMLTEKLNKHGQIKGENKKETKLLKDACPHHAYNKKGHEKARIETDGNGRCTCEMCGNNFPTSFPEHDEIKKKYNEVFDVLNTAKFAAVAADAGKDTVKYLAIASIMLRGSLKLVFRVMELVERQENVKKSKKNKKKGFSGGSSEFGSWSSTK